MIVERIYCDRCGRICKQERYSHGFRLMKNKHYVEKGMNGTPEKLDLCQRCYDSLAIWMDEKREEKNDRKTV